MKAPLPPDTKILPRATALAGIEALAQKGILSGIDLMRLRIVADRLDAEQHRAAWEDCASVAFQPGSKADTDFPKLKNRLKRMQANAVTKGLLAPRHVLTLEMTKHAGNASRYLWFTGQTFIAAQARTADLEGVETLIEPFSAPEFKAKGKEPILILTVNPHETNAVLKVFGIEDEANAFIYNENPYRLLGYTQEERPIIAFRSRMGSSSVGSALIGTAQAIQDLRPAVVLAVGIAFGRNTKKDKDGQEQPTSQKLGDVLVCTQVVNYEPGRHNPDGSIENRGDCLPAAQNWVQRTTTLTPENYTVYPGLMLSGEKLIDNPESLQQLFARYPDAVGGDMEGAGLMTACYEHKVDWLVIKGISDWGDGNKSALGDAQKNADQQRAADNAARLAYAAIYLQWPAHADVQQRQNNHSHHRPRHIDARIPDLQEAYVVLDNLGTVRGIEKQSLGKPAPTRHDGPAVSVHENLLQWLQDPEAPVFFALLGEYGMGKTICCQRLYHELRTLRNQAETPQWAREPLYFDLRNLSFFKNSERSQTLRLPTKAQLIDDLIEHGWQIPQGTTTPRYADVQGWLGQGALLIMDGLDECLVHLTDRQHPDFIRSLLELITDSDPKGEVGARMLLSCRTNFFPTLQAQARFFTGQERGQIDTHWYRPMVLLPFTEAQIREYLAKVVPDIPIAQLLDLVHNTHNLQEIAERPMTLKIIARHIEELETLRSRGEAINTARLYELVANSWLQRDNGKHHLQPEHKMRLMPALAAHLWQQGVRNLDYQALHQWFHQWRANQPDLHERYNPAVYNQNKLEEDLRTATFVVREDESPRNAEGFRFAHSSLLEFFLAKHLCSAVVQNRFDAWAMPIPSDETLDFLADLLSNYQTEHTKRAPHQASALQDTLNTWRKRYTAQASELLLRYTLRHCASGAAPQPVLAGFDLRGAQLRDWRFAATPEAPLSMHGVQFAGADLRESQFMHAHLDEADFTGAQLAHTVFIHCHLQNSVWQDAHLIATVLRHCRLQGADLRAASRVYHSQCIACTGDTSIMSSLQRHGAAAWLPSGETLPPTHPPIRLTLNTGHNAAVNACAFTPDGQRILSASSDHTLKLWDAQSGKPIQTFSGHEDSVLSCAFAPDGQRILSASSDHTLKLWDAQSGKPIQTFSGHEDSVLSCAFAPDGQCILSASDDKTLKLWDAQSGKPIQTFSGHTGWVRSCAFAPDGQRILSASLDNTLRLWAAQSGKPIQTFSGHTGWVRSCAFAPDGQRILSASSDHTLKLWDAQSGKPIQTFSGHTGWVRSCAFAPDGQRILSASSDHTLKLWDAQSGKLIQAFSGHTGWVRSCAFAPDGQRILSASSDHTLKLWDTQSGKLIQTFSGHEDSVRSCAFAPDGQRILSASSDHTLKLWDAQSGKPIQTFSGHEDSVRSCAFAPDGQRILSASDDNTLKLWDAQSGKPIQTFSGHEGPVHSCAFAPDGQRILSASYDKTLKLWDAQSGKPIQTFSGHTGWVLSCAFAPDGQRILSASHDHTLKLWDAQSGKPIQTFSGHTDEVNSCAFAPDGQRILSASYDKTLKLWDAQSGKPIQTFSGHEDSVLSCAFAPDGQRILSASLDNTLRLWAAQSGKPIQTFSGHEGLVLSCAFAPDGQRILSTSLDNTLRLWDAYSGQCQRCFWSSPTLTGHATWEPGSETTPGHVLSVSGDAWRILAWQVWDHASAPGHWMRLPLGAYPAETI